MSIEAGPALQAAIEPAPITMAASATTLNQNEVAAIQKDWKNREFVEVVKLNMLQVSKRKTHRRETSMLQNCLL